MGSDDTTDADLDALVQFQSTLPHGERRVSAVLGRLDTTFQSTLPHGERPSAMASGIVPVLFQSTLPHGERPGALGYYLVR